MFLPRPAAFAASRSIVDGFTPSAFAICWLRYGAGEGALFYFLLVGNFPTSMNLTAFTAAFGKALRCRRPFQRFPSTAALIASCSAGLRSGVSEHGL
jgi:hypothetical protein